MIFALNKIHILVNVKPMKNQGETSLHRVQNLTRPKGHLRCVDGNAKPVIRHGLFNLINYNNIKL